MKTIDDLKAGRIGIEYGTDLIRLQLILKNAFPNDDKPINGHHKYYFVVKSFNGMFGASDEKPGNITEWVKETDIMLPYQQGPAQPKHTPTPWELRYEGSNVLMSTHHQRPFNKDMATFRNPIDAVMALERINAMTGIKNPQKWMDSVKWMLTRLDLYVKNHPEFKDSDSKSAFILERAKKYDEVLGLIQELKKTVDTGQEINSGSLVIQSLMELAK